MILFLLNKQQSCFPAPLFLMRSLSLNERGIFYLTAPGLYFEACLALSPCLTSSLVQYAFAESVVTSRFGAFAQLECWNLRLLAICRFCSLSGRFCCIRNCWCFF